MAQLDPALSEFLASAVLRRLPDSYRTAAWTFSGGTSSVVVGVVLFCVFSLFFSFTLSPGKAYQDYRLSLGGVRMGVNATITRVVRLIGKGGSVSGLRCDFEYDFQNRYSTGVCYRREQDWYEAQVVPLWNLPDDPSVVCPVGATLSEEKISVYLFMMGTIVCVCGGTLLAQYLNFSRSLRLLERGHVNEYRVTKAYVPFFKSKGTAGRITIAVDGRLQDVTIKQLAVFARAQKAVESKEPAFALFDPGSLKKPFFVEWLLAAPGSDNSV